MAAASARPHQGSPSPAQATVPRQWVIFTLDSARFALPLQSVERIVHAVQLTPLPLAPAVVAGIVDVEGEVLPVFDLRHRFGLPARALDPADHLLIARTAQRRVVLIVDAAEGVQQHTADAPSGMTRFAADPAGADRGALDGVLTAEAGLILIQDLERLLSAEEDALLQDALAESRRAGAAA